MKTEREVQMAVHQKRSNFANPSDRYNSKSNFEFCRPTRIESSFQRIAVAAIGFVLCFYSVTNAETKSDTTGKRENPSSLDQNNAANLPEYSFKNGGWQLYRSDSEDGPHLTLGGNILFRHENWDWFGGPNEDAYDFDFTRARLQLDATWDGLKIFVEPQFVQMWGLPENAVDVGPSGMGALYYLHNGDADPGSFGFHQAYLQFSHDIPGDLGVASIKGGRFTYASGLEYFNPEDGKKMNTVKKLRLADRLLSSFEWSAFARSFDGAQVDFVNTEHFALEAGYMYPTEGGWDEDFNESMRDVRIKTLAATFPKSSIVPHGELGFFVYDYDDSRSCSQRIDNTEEKVDSVDLDIQIYGGHLIGVIPDGSGQWDYLLWGGIQTGDWYELDQSAYGFTAEGGYQWQHAFLKPWLRAGYFLGSGDSDPSDGDHETFFQMAPGTRKYELFPYYDLQNSESLYSQLFLFPHKKLKLRFDFSFNRLAEENDLWYMGTGPTQQSGDIFGYLGRQSGGNDDLSQEASIMVMYQASQKVDFNAFYSHVWGGDVIENNYPSDEDANYFSIQMNYKF